MATTFVLGIGPGLGMSIAQRFAAEGHAVALFSRNAARHAAYLDALPGAAAAFAVDLHDPAQLRAALAAATDRFGAPDVVYHGPGAADLDAKVPGVTEIDRTDVDRAMEVLHPAVEVVASVLPAMRERGSGTLLFAGGLGGKVAMPGLGALALAAAALRQYVVTLHAALAPEGIYAGILTIGGLVERGDIHAVVTGAPERFGDVGSRTLDPDAIADEAWRLHTERNPDEVVFSAFG